MSKETKQKRNPFEKCRENAKDKALNHGKISDCPYKKPPYKTVWIEAFSEASQQDLPFESASDLALKKFEEELPWSYL